MDEASKFDLCEVSSETGKKVEVLQREGKICLERFHGNLFNALFTVQGRIGLATATHPR